MNRRILLFTLMIICCLFSTNVIASKPVPFWKVLRTGQSFFLFGSPIKVDKIIQTREIEKNGEIFYTYKAIVWRPSPDDGRGVASFYNLVNMRLHYMASLQSDNPYIALHETKDVYQKIHSNPRKIVVHVMKGFKPGRYNLKIAIFPYPMIGNYSLRQVIQMYRSDYVAFFQFLNSLRYVSPQMAIFNAVWSKGEDYVIDEILTRLANTYGQVIQLDVMAKLPDLHKMTAKQAERELKKRNLVPWPDFNTRVANNNPNLSGRVAKQQFYPGSRLYANTKVAYKFYADAGGSQNFNPNPYGGKEICGDGIDNNNNNQIDEGCRFTREIILDDNKCDDDTMRLFVDEQSYGDTPPGHKRHYNVSKLAWGKHIVHVVGINSAGKSRGCSNNNIVTFEIRLGEGITFMGGGNRDSAEVEAGVKGKNFKRYEVFVK